MPMNKFTLGRKCPHCGYTQKKRIPRRLWMKLIPWSKNLRCEWCGCQFISIFERRSGQKDRRHSDLSIIRSYDRRCGISDRRKKTMPA